MPGRIQAWPSQDGLHLQEVIFMYSAPYAIMTNDNLQMLLYVPVAAHEAPLQPLCSPFMTPNGCAIYGCAIANFLECFKHSLAHRDEPNLL